MCVSVFWRVLCVIVDLYKKKTLGTKILSTNKKRKEKWDDNKNGRCVTNSKQKLSVRIGIYFVIIFLRNGSVLVVRY